VEFNDDDSCGSAADKTRSNQIGKARRPCSRRQPTVAGSYCAARGRPWAPVKDVQHSMDRQAWFANHSPGLAHFVAPSTPLDYVGG